MKRQNQKSNSFKRLLGYKKILAARSDFKSFGLSAEEVYAESRKQLEKKSIL
jgi:hypothetical protein